MAGNRIGGLFTALITPFDAAGQVDAEALSDLVRFQIGRGVDGLYPCGSTGLGPMLSLDERRLVAETVIKEGSGKVPVIVQVGCADTKSSMELAVHAEKAGADAVASLTPYYYKPGEAAIAEHYEAISKVVTIPVFAYNIPQFTGNSLSLKTVAALAQKGTISGIKDSERDFLRLEDLLELVPEGFIVMNGTEEYAMFAMMMGADGLVSGGANAFPEVFTDLVESVKSGKSSEALESQRKILTYKEVVKEGPIPCYYEILRQRGLDCGSPRRPFLAVEKGSGDNMMSELRKIGLS